MKRQALLLPVLAALIVMNSCQMEEVEKPEQTGLLSIRIGLQVLEHDAPACMKGAPLVQDFKVTIYLADGTTAQQYERVSDLPEFIELPTGDYFIEAYSDNILPAAFENPCYKGVSNLFTIENNQQQQVEVACHLANTAVTVAYSDQVHSDFSGFSTTVSSSLGSLTYLENENRRGYFEPAPLEVTVSLEYLKPDGTSGQKSLTGSIADPQPAKLYELIIDASIDAGMATFSVILDSTVSVETVQITEESGPLPEGPVGSGDLIFTEIMANPTALSDTEGEWLEIYNTSSEDIPLLGLVIRRDDANTYTITEDISIPPGEYLVLQRTDIATDVSGSYVYGSAITLTNSGAVLGIYNEDLPGGPGALIFELDYGSTGFPEGSGASIILGSSFLNATDAQMGENWCISTSLYSTGDLGTPGSENDICQ